MKIISLDLIILLFILFFVNLTLEASTLNTAKKLISEKQYSQSLEVLKKTTDSDPNNIEALYYLAMNYYILGEYELTVKHGVKAYTKNHKLADEVRKYANEQNFGEKAKIGMFRKIRLAKQIRNELLLILQDEPDNVNAHYALGYFYIYTPYILSGSIKKSIYHIEKLSKLDAQRAFAVYNDYFKKTKNSKKYLKNLALWRESFPNDWLATIELARYEQEYGDLEKSYKLIKNWISSNGKKSKAVYQIGRLAATSGKYLDEGEAAFEQYLSMPLLAENPTQDWAYFRLAMIYQHKQDIDKAQIYLSKALAIDSENKNFIKLKKKLKN